ncbi:MAG: HDOD domain-containing protein [Burkholderiales bacterium]|nr:HDOD domain-containing protein [Burkholderiales bacterium]
MDLEAPERALLEKLAAADIRIPPRPQILHEIERMLDDDDATERMIGQLIARDVGLTAEVFKLANSPFYRRGAKIDSLEHAVRLLGRKAMGQIVRSALLRQRLGGATERLESFWERCTDIGTLCSVLCDQLDRPGRLVSEQAYLVGLFHDCGVPVLMQHLKGYGDAQLDAATGPDYLAEDDALGTSHCIAGLMVAREWELPDLLCETIRSHHYVLAADQNEQPAVAVLQLALHAYNRCRGWPENEWMYQAERALQVLKIDPATVDDVIAAALASFEVLH